jgi:hypothetical protein
MTVKGRTYPIGRRDGVVIPAGFEPATYCLEGSCSIQLSYETEACLPVFLAERGGFESDKV